MSKLTEMIEELSEMEERNEAVEVGKIPVSTRLDDQSVWRLDLLRNRFGMSRSGMSRAILENSLCDAVEALGYDMDTQFEMYIAAKKAEKEVK